MVAYINLSSAFQRREGIIQKGGNYTHARVYCMCVTLVKEVFQNPISLSLILCKSFQINILSCHFS